MKNNVYKIKNAKLYLNNLKNNIIIANICKKNSNEYYKGDYNAKI